METRTCPTCRSINHADLARCMNCGAAMNLVPAPATKGGTPAPPSAPAAYGWSAQVATGPPERHRQPWAAISVGVIAVIAPIVIFAMIWNVDPSTLATSHLRALGQGSLLLALAYWLWMVLDAFYSRRIGWGIAILFLGAPVGLLYAVLAMSAPSPRRRA